MRRDPSHLVGVVVLRGAGAPMVQRRLPRRTTVSLGRRDRHGLLVPAQAVPLDLAVLTPVEEGWLVTNGQRFRMRVDSDWIDVGHTTFLSGGIAMVQRGDVKLTWPELEVPFTTSISVRTRRRDDARIPYAVDNAVDTPGDGPGDRGEDRAGAGQGASGAGGTYLGLAEAPMSASVRYRLAVLFRHLLEGEPEPLHLLARRAEFLGVTEAELDETAHRHRRRLNATRDLSLGDHFDLGQYLVEATGELTRADLDP